MQSIEGEARPLGPPPRWLASLVGALEPRLAGTVVEGIAGGPGWLSIRLSGRFLWLTVMPALRAAWLDAHPVAGAWLHGLGRHKQSPFAPHLEQRSVQSVQLLAEENGEPAGLALGFIGTPGLRVCAAFWPRPGAIWAEGGNHEPLARSGDDPRPDLRVIPAMPAPFELEAHAEQARTLLSAHLNVSVRRRLRDVLGGVVIREQRRIDAVSADLHQGHEAAQLRSRADVLAAHLHALKPGQSEVQLAGFAGEPVVVRLDPALTPARNLEALYRRAARGERKAQQAATRLAAAQAAKVRADEALAELGRRQSLEELLELAVELDVDFAPARAGAHRSERSRRAAPRLPYRAFLLASGWEVRVGRSAADNDALTRRHSEPADMWLHAEGVEGSHVILRTQGRAIPARELHQAAQLAALFSKARNSQTVPVVATQRRYVRKPRGSPPGRVVADRARTLFVTPELPAGCTDLLQDSGGNRAREPR